MDVVAKQMGVSRSATAVIAWCMRELGWTLDKAYAHVKKKRNIIKPNRYALSQLQDGVRRPEQACG